MVQFRMSRISVEQFAILVEEAPQAEIVVDSDVSFGVIPNKQVVAVKFNITFTHEDKKLLVMELHCYFNVRPEDWKKFEKENKVAIPKDLLAHFAMHTVGTARGVLYCKTEGTLYNQFIIPPMNVAERIPEDIVIDL